jgi:hypothetical protein
VDGGKQEMTDFDRSDFSPDAYRSLLRALSERGYRPGRFDGAPVTGRTILLRHDIDLSIDAAMPISRIEADEGWLSTYYVLVSSDLYNPGSAASRALLSEIAGMGHEIGLHFDSSLYAKIESGELDVAALERAAVSECATLSNAIGREVASISFHRPVTQLQGLDRDFAGRPHSYQPRYFREIDYCSDSGGRWKHGHPLDRAAVAAGQPMQLLTHPIWWSRAGANIPDKVDAALDRLATHSKAEASRNILPYADHLDDASNGRVRD